MNSSKIFLTLCCFIAFGLLIDCAPASAQEKSTTDVSQKTDVSKRSNSLPRHAAVIGVLGRGGIYSLGYEYLFSRQVNAGIGYSYQAMRASPTVADSQVQLHTFPIYSNMFFPFGSHRPYAGLGVTGLLVKANVDFKFNDILHQVAVTNQKNDEEADVYKSSMSVPEFQNNAELFLAIPNLAAGYEYRMRSGSFARAEVLSFIMEKPEFWFGIVLGLGF